MRRLVTVVGVLLATALTAAPVAPASGSHIRHGTRCPELFRVQQAANEARRAWAGTRTPTRRDWDRLLLQARCQRNPRASKFVHAMYHGFAKANASRRYWGNPENWPVAKASWFNDSTTACGVDASTYQWGTASEQYPCGTQVDMERNSVRITVTVIDYGPDPSTGRMWDLTPHAMQALDGMGAGVVDVHYRVH